MLFVSCMCKQCMLHHLQAGVHLKLRLYPHLCQLTMAAQHGLPITNQSRVRTRWAAEDTGVPHTNSSHMHKQYSPSGTFTKA
jgi:hypothetical protein